MTDAQLPALPSEIYVLAPHLPALAEEIVTAIAAEVPSYARPLARGSSAVRRGVHGALAEFVELSRDGEVGRRAVAADLGRREVRAGRSLDALLSAYRTGARVAWRRAAALGLEAGLAPETLVALAEAIFAYVDELSAESAEGFAREQAERAGELERRRRALAELLVASPAPDAGAVAAAAEAAHWRLPTSVSVAVWREPEAPVAPRRRVARDGRRAGACAVLAAPGRELEAALDGRAAGVGPTVPVADAARSFRLACAALALAEERGSRGAARRGHAPGRAAVAGRAGARRRAGRRAAVAARRRDGQLAGAVGGDAAGLAQARRNGRGRGGGARGASADGALPARAPTRAVRGGARRAGRALRARARAASARGMIVDLTVRPPWPSEPPRAAGPGGLVQIDGNVVRRALRVDGEVVLAEAAWRGDEVLLRAHAASEDAAREAIARMRFVLALDDELEPFHRAHRSDPVLGRIIKARPKLRVLRKPEPFEALAWAIIEQLIDTQRAGDIAWTLTRRHGQRHPQGPWCAPTADQLANTAALDPRSRCSTGMRSRSSAMRQARR